MLMDLLVVLGRMDLFSSYNDCVEAHIPLL